MACSGVGSPGVWEKFVRSMAYIKQQKPLSVDFRGKLNGESTRRFHVTFENGWDSTTRRCCGLRLDAGWRGVYSCGPPATPAAIPARTVPVT